tara:strand:+ start:449 stop:817 length:369 start_codon:yes stop_codon:yes gene_type:complete
MIDPVKEDDGYVSPYSVGVLDVNELIKQRKYPTNSRLLLFEDEMGFVQSRNNEQLKNPSYSIFRSLNPFFSESNNETFVYYYKEKWVDFTNGEKPRKKVFLTCKELENLESFDCTLYYENQD